MLSRRALTSENRLQYACVDADMPVPTLCECSREVHAHPCKLTTILALVTIDSVSHAPFSKSWLTQALPCPSLSVETSGNTEEWTANGMAMAK